MVHVSEVEMRNQAECGLMQVAGCLFLLCSVQSFGFAARTYLACGEVSKPGEIKIFRINKSSFISHCRVIARAGATHEPSPSF